jgi:hypothetical protein
MGVANTLEYGRGLSCRSLRDPRGTGTDPRFATRISHWSTWTDHLGRKGRTLP